MNDFDAVIYSVLIGSATVKSAVAAVTIDSVASYAIFNGRIPEALSSADPACVFSRISPVPLSETTVRTVLYNVLCYGKTKSNLDTLTSAVLTAFHRETVTVSGRKYYFHAELQAPRVPGRDNDYWEIPVLITIMTT